MKLRSLICAAGAGSLLGACAALAPVDELTWSSELARTLPLQEGPVVEAARFSELRPGAFYIGDWQQWEILDGTVSTDYRLVENDGVVVIEADSGPTGGTALSRNIHIDPRRTPIIEWRWRVPRDSAGAASRGSPPVRISLAFDGDAAKLDFDDRAKLRLAKALTVNGLPYASLLYVWRTDLKLETVYSSPHTDRVRFIVVESGEKRVDQWVTMRRNILEDYRRAFGEEPGDVVAVDIMTDYGDNGAPRRAQYGDITFRQP